VVCGFDAAGDADGDDFGDLAGFCESDKVLATIGRKSGFGIAPEFGGIKH
jgi:hypothetical protein